jgi:hypothetical protein
MNGHGATSGRYDLRVVVSGMISQALDIVATGLFHSWPFTQKRKLGAP